MRRAGGLLAMAVLAGVVPAPGVPGAVAASPVPTAAGSAEVPAREARPQPRSAARPNVLLIVTDDQRAGTIKLMPDTTRWLRRGGTTFTRAHATTPFCCPARASIFTGRYAHNHGIRRGMDEAPGHEDPGSEFQRSTLQRYLQDAGYATGIFGKYLNRWDLSLSPPYFDHWTIMAGRYVGASANVGGTLTTIPDYWTTYVRRQAVRFLREAEEEDARPWFLYLAVLAPHGPFTPERRYAHAPVPPWRPSPAALEEDLSDKPPVVLEGTVSLRDVRRLRTRQLRTLMSVDDLVDRVMRELGRLGERRDTLVILTSDNGFLWREHGMVGKRRAHTPSIRVPLLLRWPGRVAAGARDGRAVALVDLAPTVLEAAGIVPEHVVDGRSLLGAWDRDRLLLEYWKGSARLPDWASLRTRAAQYVEYYDADGAVLFREYYDLTRDRWQLHNLLGDTDPENDPDVSAIAQQLALDRRCSGTEGPAACP